MSITIAPVAPPPPTSRCAFTLRGTLVLYGRTLKQTQYVTDRYVITHVDRGMFIFLRDRGERFLVDRAASRLRRLDVGVQRIRVDKLRPVIGEIEVTQDPKRVEVAGFACKRYRFQNANARVVISGETCTTAIEGMEGTALQAERERDALDQPFTLPLGPEEVVVESRLRTVASDFEQNQVYRLEAVEPDIPDIGEYDRMARLAIIV